MIKKRILSGFLLAIFFITTILTYSIYAIDDDPIDPEDEPIPILVLYYNGALMWQGSEDEKPVVENVKLTIGDMELIVPVKPDGTFSRETNNITEKAIVSIPDENYVIPTVPEENNIIYPSNSATNTKNIYFSKSKTIQGQVTNYDEGVKVSDASVTCYKRVDGSDEWELWGNNNIISSSEWKTDAEGKFKIPVINGEYRIQAKKNGYDDYNSFNQEYIKDNISLINTNKDGNLSPILHMTESKVLRLVESYPANNQAVLGTDYFYLIFDKQMIQKPLNDKESNLRLQSSDGGSIISCNFTLDKNKILIKPKTTLKENQPYKLVVTKNIIAIDGSSLKSETVINFTIKANTDLKNGNDDGTITGNDAVNEEPVQTKIVKFDDIENHWAKDYINVLAQKGILNGNEQNGSILFYPDNEISRKEFAKLIILAENIPVVEAKDLQFVDSSKIEDWAKPYIATANAQGLMKGIEKQDGIYFEPDLPITRAEIITIIGRLLGQSELVAKFADWNEVPDWAKNYVSICVDKMIITGYNEDGQQLIKPLKNVTRAEAATIIAKLINLK